MTMLKESATAWGTTSFASTLKAEMETLRSGMLPIAHVIGDGNRLDDSDLGVIVNEVSDDAGYIYAKVGVFFAEIVNCTTCSGGSGMCDEAYCELVVIIDKASGAATIAPI